jgi:hypothetical protein
MTALATQPPASARVGQNRTVTESSAGPALSAAERQAAGLGLPVAGAGDEIDEAPEPVIGGLYQA